VLTFWRHFRSQVAAYLARTLRREGPQRVRSTDIAAQLGTSPKSIANTLTLFGVTRKKSTGGHVRIKKVPRWIMYYDPGLADWTEKPDLTQHTTEGRQG